jgi:hypothetical protein
VPVSSRLRSDFNAERGFMVRLGGRSHLLRFQRVTWIIQGIRCISTSKVRFERKRIKIIIIPKLTRPAREPVVGGSLGSTLHPTDGADTDVWPFRQIASSNQNMQSAPASGPSSVQARAMLPVENARFVPP